MGHRRSKKQGSSATGWDRKGADILSVLCRTDPDAPPERGVSVLVVERPAFDSRKIAITSGDSQATPVEGVSAARRLIDRDKVDFIIGNHIEKT